MQITAVLERKCAITNPIGRHGVADVDTSIEHVTGQNDDDQGKQSPSQPPHYHSPSVCARAGGVFLVPSPIRSTTPPRACPSASASSQRHSQGAICFRLSAHFCCFSRARSQTNGQCRGDQPCQSAPKFDP